jgi:hypothetical protein
MTSGLLSNINIYIYILLGGGPFAKWLIPPFRLMEYPQWITRDETGVIHGL